MITSTESTSRALDRRLGLAVFFAALILAVAAHRQTFTEPFVVNNDALQHTYWMRQFAEPDLFADDLLTVYAREYQPPGWVAFYRLASLAVDPLLLSRALGPLLFALSAWLLLRLVGRFAPPAVALLAAALFTASPFFLQKMAGGHPRAFAVPLLLLALDLLVRGRLRTLGAVLFLHSLVYPMGFVLAAATAVPTLAAPWLRTGSRENRVGALLCALGILAGGCGLVAVHEFGRDPRIGPTVSGETLRASPELYAGGRATHLPTPGPLAIVEETLRQGLPNSRLAWRGGQGPRRMPRWELLALAPLLAWGVLLAARRKVPFPAPLLHLLLASAALYGLAELLLLRLFLPRRYAMYSLPLLALVVLALALGDLVARLPAPSPRKAAAAGLLVLAALHARALDDAGLDDYSEHAGLYRFAAALPEDALLAGNPYLLDGVPLFAGREVLVSYELSNPYFTTYWQEVTRRIDDLFEALYAEDLATAAAFCERYRVTHLVVDLGDFRPERIEGRRGIYFEPFGSRIRERLRGRERFALEGIPAEDRLFTSADGEVFAVAAEALR